MTTKFSLLCSMEYVFYVFHFHFWMNYPFGNKCTRFANIILKFFQKSGQNEVTVMRLSLNFWCVCVWEAAWSAALPCHVWWHTVGQCSDWRSHSQSLFCAVSKQLARMDLPLPPAREMRWSLRPHKHNTVSSDWANNGAVLCAHQLQLSTTARVSPITTWWKESLLETAESKGTWSNRPGSK